MMLEGKKIIVTGAAFDIGGGLSMTVMNHMPGRKWS